MRLIMLLGAARGTVVESEDTPLTYTVEKIDVSLHRSFEGLFQYRKGVLRHEYVLFAHGPEEAYYVPRGFNNLQVVKGLLAAP